MRTIVTSTITAAVAPLMTEIDGDVVERRDLGLATPNQLTPVYKARRMNTKKLHEATAKRTLGSTSVSLGHSILRVSTVQFVAWADSVLGFSSPVRSFVRSRSTDMLQTSQLPQKMMPCHGTFSVATVHHSISQHKTVHAVPVWQSLLDELAPAWTCALPRFRPTNFLGQRGLHRHLTAMRNRRGFPLPFWEGVGSVTRRTLENAAFAPQSSEHALRKAKQLERLAPSLLSCVPVDHGHVAGGTRPPAVL